MNELTPERIRDAAEVLQAWATGGYTRTVRELREYADKLERDQADKAKREQRLEEFTDELLAIAYPDTPMPPLSELRRMSGMASALLALYPALMEGAE